MLLFSFVHIQISLYPYVLIPAETPFPGTISNVVFDFMPRGLAKAKMMLQMMGAKAKTLWSQDHEGGVSR